MGGKSTHTFSLFIEDNKWNWFEYSWEDERGIHEFPTKQEALVDICKKHISYHKQCHNIQMKEIELYRYPKATVNFTTKDFIKHCIRGERLSKDLIR